MKFNGINWVYVGEPGISSGMIYNCSLTFSADGKPYLAYDDGGNSRKATVKYYPVHDSCNHADYVAWPDSIQPLTIHFLDQSYGDIGSWFWNFGDDSTSTEKNPTHTYSASGIPYTVCLEVNSPDSICSNVHCATVLPGALGCQAIFAHYPDTLHPFAVQFQDHSVWGVIQWHWDFGDGTTSTERNPLHLFPHGGHFQVCLTIQTAPQYACGTTTCKDVYVWNASHCGGYFTYTSTNLLADFYGHSVNGNTETYSWNFGDNQTGQGQNTQHQYATAGAYNVVLSTVDSSGCTNDTAQTITITDTLAYLQVYGQVFGGAFPVREGEVLIFSVDTVPPYQPYADVAGIDSTGVYYYVTIPPGDYYLYGIPVNNSGYLPTYFGDVLYWEDANILHLGLPNNPYKIDLIQATDFLSGNGSINVHINVGGLKSTLLIDNITMLLMNSEHQTILYTKADDQGDFPFSSLAYGTYYLKAEIAGVKSDVIMVVLTPDNPQASVVMTFTGNRILGIQEVKTPGNSFKVYPNPVSDKANIAIHLTASTNVLIKLLNLTGQQVFSMNKQMNAGNSVLYIPVSYLPAGMYTLCIISGNGIQYVAKLIR
jgi:PKD repeat protein